MRVVREMAGVRKGGRDLEIENGEWLNSWISRYAMFGVMWLEKQNDAAQKQYCICYSEIYKKMCWGGLCAIR